MKAFLKSTVFFCLILGIGVSNAERRIQTQVGDGGVSGKVIDGVAAFMGIPFAKAPVGKYRFRPPEKPDKWVDVLNATEFPNSCHGMTNGASMLSSANVQSEDCLYLNVWAPADVLGNRTAENLPVVVFLHGGGFLLGSGTHPHAAPDPIRFVRANRIVYVTLNYRLGPLGFLSHRALPESFINVGLQDQTLALKWVKENIDSFAGNKEEITLMGNSAGAFSICFHLADRSLEGLFKKVILQSAICDFPFQPLSESYDQGDSLTKAVGCSDAETEDDLLRCLGEIDIETLKISLPLKRGLIWNTGVRWFPVAYPVHPYHKLMAGDHLTDVHVMMGTCEEEGNLFMFLGFPIYFPEVYVRSIMHTFLSQEDIKMMEEYYGLQNVDRYQWEIVAQALTDMWECSTHRLARLLSSHGQKSMRLYEFAIEPSYLDYPIFRNFGTHHGLDIIFLFGSGELSEKFLPTEVEVSKNMTSVWGWYIKDPEVRAVSAAFPHHDWPEYNPKSNDTVLRFEDRHMEFGGRPKACDIWDKAVDDNFLIKVPGDTEEDFLSWVLNAWMLRKLRSIGLPGILAVLAAVVFGAVMVLRPSTAKKVLCLVAPRSSPSEKPKQL